MFQLTRGRDRPTLVYSRPVLTFFLGGPPTLVLTLGEVQLPPPGPGMAVTGRKDLNSRKPKQNQPWFGASRDEESESPGVVTKSQESESETESIKLPRLRPRLRLVYHKAAHIKSNQNAHKVVYHKAGPPTRGWANIIFP